MAWMPLPTASQCAIVVSVKAITKGLFLAYRYGKGDNPQSQFCRCRHASLQQETRRGSPPWLYQWCAGGVDSCLSIGLLSQICATSFEVPHWRLLTTAR